MAKSRVDELRLVRASEPVAPSRRLDPTQQRVVDHAQGVLQVLGGPGTGKTAVLEAAAAQRISDGADPSTVLVLTFGRRSAAAMRDAITARVGRALREPPVRSVSSYAFSILTRAHERRDWERPRLITGPEQDMIIRELVAGALGGEGVVSWPDRLRAALPTRGFATELRDVLMRCAERGISGATLAGLGRQHGRDDWIAVAQFMREFSSVAGLSNAGAYDPAELVRAVLDAFAADPALLDAERDRLCHLFVDEAHDLDRAQAGLIELVAGEATSYVVAGDPDQSVFGFRGADPTFLSGFATAHAARSIVLPTTYRSGPEVLAALRIQSARLPGMAQQRQSRALVPDAAEPSTGRVEFAVAATEAREATTIAHRLRAAHLLDDVPWSQMAVAVRSVSASLPALRRAFLAAEVPMTVTGDDLPVADSPAVRGLLDLVVAALRSAAVTSEQFEHILTSLYVGLDALGVRRIRRVLRGLELAEGGTRSSTAILRDCFADPRELIRHDQDTVRPLVDLVTILATIRSCAAEGGDPEQILYAAWSATGVQRLWRERALSGGPHAARADAHLDAVVAMFDAVGAFVERLPAADVFQFGEFLAGQELPADRLSPSTPDDGAVRVVTATNAKGHEWDLVVVCGLQDGRWPNLVPRGSLLGSEQLVDLDQGMDPALAMSGRTRSASLLAEERRLLYVASSRARRWLLFTAREGLDERPSRFFEEIRDQVGVHEFGPATGARRGLSVIDTVAELRSVVVDPGRTDDLRSAAAGCLSDFATARVPGAGPDDWYGVPGPSDDRPLYDDVEPVPVSPSKVETFARCELRWLLERVGGSSSGLVAASVGTLVHDALESLGDTAGLDRRQIADALRTFVDHRWGGIDFDAAWEGRAERTRVAGMIDNLAQWLDDNPRQFLGAEVAFTVPIGRAVLTGKLDRIEVAADGSVVVVDLKTGKTPLAKGKVPDNPQLGTYQLAVEQDALLEVTGGEVESGGAELLYVSGKLSPRPQPPLRDYPDPKWVHQLVQTVADAMAGAQFVARDGDLCAVCPVRTSCPVQPEGRQLGSTS